MSLNDGLAHARAMSTAEHKPECHRYLPRHMYPKRPDPECPGCVTDDDRALWKQQADELEAYLAGDDEPTLEGL